MFHDPVRVPEEAGEGKAEVTVSFADWKTAKVAATTTEVPIVDAGAAAEGEDAQPVRKPATDQPAARGGISVRIEAPKSEPLANVRKVIKALKAAGVKNIAVGTAKPDEKITAIIQAPEDTPAGKVQEVIETLQRAGVENFALRAKE